MARGGEMGKQSLAPEPVGVGGRDTRTGPRKRGTPSGSTEFRRAQGAEPVAQRERVGRAADDGAAILPSPAHPQSGPPSAPLPTENQ